MKNSDSRYGWVSMTLHWAIVITLILSAWYVFVGLVVLHVGAAIWHHRVKKDDTLKRMVPWGKVS